MLTHTSTALYRDGVIVMGCAPDPDDPPRLAACYNGCQGVADPQTTVPEMIRLLNELDDALDGTTEYAPFVERVSRLLDQIQDVEEVPDSELVGAEYRSGVEIPVYDDGFGSLYVLRNSMGVQGVVRAGSWETAYEICQDEFFPEATETVEELVEEYGENWIEDPCFDEAFGFRPNGPNSKDTLNHGIYARDLNGEYLDELTDSLLSELGLVIRFKRS